MQNLVMPTRLAVRDVTMKNVAVIAFDALKTLTGGYMRLDIYDGLLQKRAPIKIVDTQEIPKDRGTLPVLCMTKPRTPPSVLYR